MPAGQILCIFPSKYVAITVVTLFEIGSLVCALAPTMRALIAGRAIQGAGAGTIFVTMMSVMSQVTSLKQRPAFAGMGGAVFGIASIIGPVVGGALTSQVTWRWCFYVSFFPDLADDFLTLIADQSPDRWRRQYFPRPHSLFPS